MLEKTQKTKIKLANSCENWELLVRENKYLELSLKGKSVINAVQKDNSNLQINIPIGEKSEFELELFVWQIGGNCKSEIKIWGKIGVEKVVKIKVCVFHLGKSGQSLQKSAFLVNGNLELSGEIVINAKFCEGVFENRNLLFDGIARIEPFLQIHELPQKCEHSTTTGSLETETLEYLNSRGLGYSQSKKLITRYFLTEFDKN